MMSSHHNLSAILGKVSHGDGEMFNIDTMKLWVRMAIYLKCDVIITAHVRSHDQTHLKKIHCLVVASC